MLLSDLPITDAVQWASPFVTGGLAAWIFYFYRQDRKDSRERFAQLVQQYNAITMEFRGIVERNTIAITKLIIVVEHINGKR